MMANKPLQSIKFPGLSDTYTTPQVDATLTTAGAAADAKKTGDEITDLKQDLSDIDERVEVLENGGVEEKTVSGGEVVTITDGVVGVKIGSLVFAIDPSLTGVTEATVSHSEADTSNPETITVSWEDDAGTIYGGTVTLHGDGTAELVKEWAKITINDIKASDLNKSTGYGSVMFYTKFYYISDQKAAGLANVMSDGFATHNGSIATLPDMSLTGINNGTYIYFRDDRYTYASDFFTAHKNDVIVYELATPQTIQLSGLDQLATYAGTNKFWVDTGDVESLTYYIKKSEINIDPTLSNEGEAADAKAVGDALDELSESVDNRISTYDDSINWLYGKSYELTSANYWGGAAKESNINMSTSPPSGVKCVMVTLPANKILRLVTARANSDVNILEYWVFDATTGNRLDYGDDRGLGVPYLYYLKFAVDTHVYININTNYEYFIQILNVSSPYAELEKVTGYKYPSIMDFNGRSYISHAIRSLKWPQRNKRVPAVFLHFSDIHGNQTNLKRIVDFMNDSDVSPYLDDVICSGDEVLTTLNDGMDFFRNTPGSESIILTTGNHDVVVPSGGTYVDATKEAVYGELFENVSEWDVTQPTGAEESYLCYFYKDYDDYNLRFIYIDPFSQGDSNYIADELTWFTDVLADAETNNLSVVCVNHYPLESGTFTYMDCSFSPRYNFSIAGGHIPASFVSAVGDFIDGGGEFVCWLVGHGHQDYVLLDNAQKQLCIGVSCATYGNTEISYSDDKRIYNTKSQDLFNIIGIDTDTKNISIFRVGCDLTRLMNSKRHLCINYATRTIIWND